VCGVTPSHFFNNLPEFILRHWGSFHIYNVFIAKALIFVEE
jgi:hypothetical protein